MEWCGRANHPKSTRDFAIALQLLRSQVLIITPLAEFDPVAPFMIRRVCRIALCGKLKSKSARGTGL